MKNKGKEVSRAANDDVFCYGGDDGGEMRLDKSKCIELDYFNGKVELELNIQNQKLRMMIMKIFSDSFSEVKYFSILQFLKKQTITFDEPFKHRVDAKEAISLIFHIKQIRKGSTNVDRQLKEAINVLEGFEIDQREIQVASNQKITEKLEERRNIILNEAQNCRQRLKEFRKKREKDIQYDFFNTEDYIKLQYLRIHIKQLNKKLLNEIIIGIRQLKEEIVEIIFEQSYPSMTMKISSLKELIGEQMYFEKKMDFMRKFNHVQKLGINNTNLIVCHCCKKIIEKEYVRCTNSDMTSIVRHYRNSPKIYYQRLIAYDYCYSYKDAPQIEEEFHYYTYNINHHKRTYCNRLFCINCLEKQSSIKKYDDIVKNKCDFCRMVCQCDSCLIANEMVRSFAYMYDILKKNYQPLNIFRGDMDFVNFEGRQLGGDDYIRQGFRNCEKEDYIKYYHQSMDKFEKVYKAVEKYRHLLASHPLEQANPSYKLTPEQKAISKYFDEDKFAENQDLDHIPGKTLKSVKKCNEEYERRIREKRKPKKKEKSIGEQFVQKYDIHNILRKYCVTEQEPLQLPDEIMTLQHSFETKMQIQSQCQPFSEDIPSKLIYPKDQIQYSQEDYEKALFVENKCKILSERQIQFQQLVEEDIFHEASGTEYCPLNFTYTAYFDNFYKYLAQGQPVNEDLTNRFLPQNQEQESSSSSSNRYSFMNKSESSQKFEGQILQKREFDSEEEQMDAVEVQSESSD